MLSDLDNFYLRKEEPAKSCLLALREIILSQDADITAAWKYGMPFFCYKGKMFCYLWVNKQGCPYIGIVEGKNIEHPKLIAEKRSRMKIFLVDPDKDLPMKSIQLILKQALDLYLSGKIKIK
ncbi:MAG: DUF1801 domain-containing protein [Bacteroidia bacterium]